MANNNVFKPVAPLGSVAPKVGGLCQLSFFKWGDVDTWPDLDPATGYITGDLVLKSGASFYTVSAMEKDRTFREVLKPSPAGPYLDVQLTATLSGNHYSHVLSLSAMQFHRFGLLFRDRSGEYRLLGSEDAGAVLEYDYSTGDNATSRLRNLKFSFESPLPIPIYAGGSIVLDDAPIIIGGGSSNNNIGALQLLTSFEVGAPGAPMVDGDSVYTNTAITGKNVLVFADGLYLPKVVHPIKRHIVKSGNSITFFGGVMNEELIEIYTY